VNLRLSVHGRRESRPLASGPALESGSPCATRIVTTAQGWRLLHDNESGALEVPHDPIAAIYVSESWTRFLPLNCRAKAMEPRGEFGVVNITLDTQTKHAPRLYCRS
jgi:hypothetical protein